jgi:hypothetical protein
MIETIVRTHNTRIVMAIAERLHLPRDREPPLLGVYLIALADAARGSSDSALRLAGALGKQRRGLGYGPDALSHELELAHSAILELMIERAGPAFERLTSVTRACKREALARLAEGH